MKGSFDLITGLMNVREADIIATPGSVHITLTYNGISIPCFKTKAPINEIIMVIMKAMIAIMNAKMAIMNAIIAIMNASMAIMISLFQILKSL